MNIIFMQNLPSGTKHRISWYVRKMMRSCMEKTVIYIWLSAITTMTI